MVPLFICIDNVRGRIFCFTFSRQHTAWGTRSEEENIAKCDELACTSLSIHALMTLIIQWSIGFFLCEGSFNFHFKTIFRKSRICSRWSHAATSASVLCRRLINASTHTSKWGLCYVALLCRLVLIKSSQIECEVGAAMLTTGNFSLTPFIH